ncbi:hypothetical protein V8C42DRAFT_356442 [Trichoderma barbatum]
MQPDPHQPNGLRRYEGLGFKRTMGIYGYAWFLDKIDWNTLTFRQLYAAYMMFNNPSMQTAYRARYHQVRDVRINFIRVNKAYQWMLEFSAIPACLDLLEDYLRELCLCAFRKDVSALKPECIEAAMMNSILEEYQPLQLAWGNRLAVKDINVLFAWLWKSKDDHFERKGWNEKTYRMLFQQSFHAIKTARGKAGARLMRHYAKSRVIGTLTNPLPATNVKRHPVGGWILANTMPWKDYMPYVIQPEQELVQMPESELYARLVILREQILTPPSPGSSAVPILEMDNSLDGGYFPHKGDEATSDEESLAVMRKKQAQDIRRMETRVRELIEEFKQRYPQWQKSYNPVIRELDHRLEKVENI